MPTEITLEGKTYRYIGGDWFNAETFIKAPEIIVQRLEMRRPRKPKPPQKKTSTQTPRKKPTRSMGRAFDGLQSSDFKQGIKGTTWRRRSELAGLISRQLYDAVDVPFLSHVVYRQPIVHIAPLELYDKESAATFDFRLNDSLVRYGFRVEKGKGRMDDQWDWPRVLSALENQSIQEQVDAAMRQYDLSWYVEMSHNDEITRTATVTLGDDGLLWKENDEETELTWADFVSRLREVPFDWACSLHLWRLMDEETAVNAGVNISKPVVALFQTLLPLYEASTEEKKA